MDAPTTPQSATPRSAAQDAAAWLAQADRAHAAGDLTAACAALERAAAVLPQGDDRRPQVLSNVGLLRTELGRAPEALPALREAVALDPNFAPAWLNLALALRRVGDDAGAAAAQARALTLDSTSVPARIATGLAASAAAQPMAALEHQRAALRQTQPLPEAHTNLGLAWLDLGDAALAGSALRAAWADAPQDRQAASNLVMAQQYDAHASAAEFRATAAAAGALWATGAARPPARSPRPPARPLRVGLLSGDLRAHPVGWLLAPLLPALAARGVELVAFDNTGRPNEHAGSNPLAATLRSACLAWHDIAALGDEAAAALVQQARIDVLLDLSGHSQRQRLGVVALRPAPLQLCWLGWFASTGLAACDGLVLGDDAAGPAAETFCTEPLLRLPRPHFVWAPPAYAPLPDPLPPSQRHGCVRFGSFNNPAKLGDGVLALWARVLEAVPGSRLLLKWTSLAEPAAAAHLRQRCAAQGLDPARLDLRGASPHAAMVAEYDEVDVALDPFPFSGLQTTLEALAMGVPVVTMPGLRPVSRQTAGVLRAIGRPEWIADKPSNYVAIAAALAADLPTRRTARAAGAGSLRAALAASPMGDADDLAQVLEAAWTKALLGASAHSESERA